jgi:hypothetical protein
VTNALMAPTDEYNSFEGLKTDVSRDEDNDQRVVPVASINALPCSSTTPSTRTMARTSGRSFAGLEAQT